MPSRHRFTHHAIAVLCTLPLLGLLAGAIAFAQDTAFVHTHHATTRATGAESAFLAENDMAMNQMMAAMTVQPSGDVDRDFVAMMAPHHQGAIDMALAVLRYGHNEQIRRLAQEIIVTQRQEIAAMYLAIGETPSPALSTVADQPAFQEKPL